MDYDLRDYSQRQPPHWCCDGHAPIGHFDSEIETCPVCELKARLDAILELIDGKEDASCEPGDERYRPNLAMQVGQIARGEDRP